MATKSKTQRAKASERRRARKEAQVEGIEEKVEAVEEEAPKKSLFSKSEGKKESEGKVEAKPKKKVRFQFLQDVRSEMKRVTWPTRIDVLRWSGVVVGALLFFGIFVFVLDNAIITPALIAYSGLGA